MAVVPADIAPDFEPQFSPDGRSVGYATYVGEKYVVVVGTKRSESFDGGSQFDSRAPIFSADGKSVAFAAKKGGKYVLVLDGKTSPPMDVVRGLTFSPSGHTLAYVGGIDNQQFVMVGDQKGSEFSRVDTPVFSPDGKKVAYGAVDNVYPTMVGGGSQTRRPSNCKKPVWSADGSVVAYIEESREKRRVNVGQDIGPEFDWVSGLSFAPVGRSFAYVARNDKRWFVVVDGKKGEEFDEVERVEPPSWSPDGKTVAYAAKNGEKWFIVSGGQKGPEFGGVSSPAWSRDGKVLSYLASEGGSEFSDEGKVSFLVVGGKRGAPLGAPGDRLFLADAVLSPDATRVAYPVAKDKKIYIMVGDKRGEGFDRISPPVWSADGKKVAHGAMKGRELWWKVRSIE